MNQEISGKEVEMIRGWGVLYKIIYHFRDIEKPWFTGRGGKAKIPASEMCLYVP